MAVQVMGSYGLNGDALIATEYRSRVKLTFNRRFLCNSEIVVMRLLRCGLSFLYCRVSEATSSQD